LRKKISEKYGLEKHGLDLKLFGRGDAAYYFLHKGDASGAGTIFGQGWGAKPGTPN